MNKTVYGEVICITDMVDDKIFKSYELIQPTGFLKLCMVDPIQRKIVYEKIDGTAINRIPRAFFDHQARETILKQIAEQLYDLHVTHRLIHGSIRPYNIVVIDTDLKIRLVHFDNVQSIVNEEEDVSKDLKRFTKIVKSLCEDMPSLADKKHYQLLMPSSSYTDWCQGMSLLLEKPYLYLKKEDEKDPNEGLDPDVIFGISPESNVFIHVDLEKIFGYLPSEASTEKFFEEEEN